MLKHKTPGKNETAVDNPPAEAISSLKGVTAAATEAPAIPLRLRARCSRNLLSALPSSEAIMAHQEGCKVFPLVKEVRAYVKEGDGDQGADCHDVADEHWINGTDPSTNNTPIANPMSGYAQYAGARKSWGINALGGLVVEIEADDGTTGVGVTIGGAAGAQIVERHLARFVEGRDPRDVESFGCVEIKILRRVRAESSRRPPRHRRDACLMARVVLHAIDATPA